MIVVLPYASAMPLSDLEIKLSELDFFIWGYDAITASGTSSARSGYIAKAARRTYDPIRHARSLMIARHPDWAFEILTQIPESMLQDPLVVAEVAANKIICTLAWDSKEGVKNRLARFFYSQVTFYDAVAVAPLAHEPYLCHAEFWKRIGDPSMRARLIRSARQAAVESVRQRIEEPAIVENSQRREFVPPEWRPLDWKPRVLFIMYPRPHYGLDVQYYGLCEVLGDENVIEYPFKPTLHGEKPEELAHYPCMFNRKGLPHSLEDILLQLERGGFDVVIYGDVEGFIDEQSMKAIRAAAGETPIVLFDAQDDPLEQWEKVDAYIDGGLRMHFKREMLSCWDYGGRTVPMPFAYADFRVPASLGTARTTPLFWAGHRQFALRRLYLEQIEAKFGFDLRKSYKQEEYAAALSNSRIGLNIFGFGYDTVRYWEIPAHGAMLLAERMPIDIPHNFVDGETAVFFDDLGDLEEKLAYYAGHLEESAAIAARGQKHFLKYHTASARARQMLGWMQSRLFEGEV
ncbi:MAG: glycosyltransferase family 1 protein [Candidatus Hydrogenedentes bacterium]|nr:glycosyltransferase family 1 protein [Candidatus Hydrogenedentota bacterium]